MSWLQGWRTKREELFNPNLHSVSSYEPDACHSLLLLNLWDNTNYQPEFQTSL